MKKLAILMCIVALTLSFTANALADDDDDDSFRDKYYSYAVKFVCGVVAPAQIINPQSGGALASGIYRTAINVHNPNERDVDLQAKLVSTDPPNLTSDFVPFTFGNNEANELDCKNITGWPPGFGKQSIFFPSQSIPQVNLDRGAWVKGFIVIQAERRLDVTAVYTVATPSPGGDPGTPLATQIDVEQIFGREVKEGKAKDLED